MSERPASEPQVSIIVPVHDVASTLPRCVDSLLAQTFTDIEILLVENGSTDDSAWVAAGYADLDPRVIFVNLPDVADLSTARNAGIERSRGRYLAFVDGDDYVEPGFIEMLLDAARSADAPIAVCGFYDVYVDSSVDKYPDHGRAVLNAHDALAELFRDTTIAFIACNKLFRRDLFDDLRFPEGRLHEDAFVMPRLFDAAGRIAVHNVPLYRYVHRRNSILSTGYSRRNLDLIWAFKRNYRFIAGAYPDLREEADARLIWAVFCVIDKMILADDTRDLRYRRFLTRYLRGRFLAIMNNAYLRPSRKMATVLLCIGFPLYAAATRTRKRQIERERERLHD